MAAKIIILNLALFSSTGFSLNGLRPIGVSAASRALGGTGVASYYNHYEAIYKNPALMNHAPYEEGLLQATFGLTYGTFTPRVKATYGSDQDYKKPMGGTSAVFPSGAGVGQRYNSFLSWGIGFYGGGGGADYSDSKSVYKAKSRTIAFSLTPGLAIQLNDHWSLGGNVSVSSVDTQASNESITKGIMVDTGGKDITYGSLFGLSYRDGPLTFGMSIQPKQTALLLDARDIDEDGQQDNLLFSAIPSEFAMGISWQATNWKTIIDYRFLQWSQADFLEAVGWKDQHVAAIGFEYGKDHGIRVGGNFCTDAVSDKFGENGFATTVVSNKPMINLAADAFAATSGLGVTNKHYTLGSFHKINSDFKVESALVYMDVGSLERAGAYNTPTGEKIYGWRSEFTASTIQIEMTYLW